MGFTFFRALGYEVGDSLVEEDYLEEAKRLMEEAGDRLVLPVDVVVADAMEEGAESETVAVDHIPSGKMGLDIGQETVALFEGHIWDEHHLLERPDGRLRDRRLREGHGGRGQGRRRERGDERGRRRRLSQPSTSSGSRTR